MIAIAGGKGGCGKTTTTLGVARALCDAGIGTRAVDLDAGMPNLHRMASVDREPSLGALVDGGDARVGRTDDGSADDAECTDDLGAGARIQRDAHGAAIVPAPRTLADLDVPAALDAIRPDDGVALLDCPAGAGPAATTPLREADAAILVTTGRGESVEDAAKTGRMARSLGVPVLGAVVTRSERVTRGIEAELATERTITIPHRREPLADGRVRECYRSIAGWIEEWLRESRTHSRSTPPQDPPRARPDDGAENRQPWDRCANCGGAVAASTPDRTPTRRRDRRSRRSPAPGDSRSSARGGGAPSGPR